MERKSRAGMAVALLLGGCGSSGVAIIGEVDGASLNALTEHESAERDGMPSTCTHVMAVNPQTANPQRWITNVGSDGSFALEVAYNRPYVLVFIDATQSGTDMVLGVFRANTLDTITPTSDVDLETVQIDRTSRRATSGVAYDTLLTRLGLGEDEAERLGAIDDLSLRYANPDVDGNGTIDVLESGREFILDFHIRAETAAGASGDLFTVDDIIDEFLPTEGDDVATVNFNLGSLYLAYPASLDETEYVNMENGPAVALSNGARFTQTNAPTSNTSFSAVAWGDMAGWGPDYDFDIGAELPGSNDAMGPSTLQYTLGASETTLTFSNVVTMSEAELEAEGVMIFVKLDTRGGSIRSISYEWRHRDGATWTLMADAEIERLISSDGGHVSIHGEDWSDQDGVSIPAHHSGTVSFATHLEPDEICGLAVSFDDQLGMRHFVGGVNGHTQANCR